jgi:hypothetical protein
MHKYIFVAGAPGSGWSRVALSIHRSPSVDYTDWAKEQTWTFINDRNLEEKSYHSGVYFGPDQKYGKKFDRLNELTKEEIEQEMNRPFKGTGSKIIKCHDFAYQLDFISKNWPECPIIVCHRSTELCYSWWMYVGGADISFPSYKMLKTIDPKVYMNKCNEGIEAFLKVNKTVSAESSIEMCEILELDYPKDVIYYDHTNVRVKV